MTDIVEQLRSVSGCTQKTFMHSPDWEEGRKIINDAAAEIDRLRRVALIEGDDFARALDEWIEREFAGYGVAIRRKSDAPIYGEPFISMEEAKELTRRAVAAFALSPAERGATE